MKACSEKLPSPNLFCYCISHIFSLKIKQRFNVRYINGNRFCSAGWYLLSLYVIDSQAVIDVRSNQLAFMDNKFMFHFEIIICMSPLNSNFLYCCVLLQQCKTNILNYMYIVETLPIFKCFCRTFFQLLQLLI